MTDYTLIARKASVRHLERAEKLAKVWIDYIPRKADEAAKHGKLEFSLGMATWDDVDVWPAAFDILERWAAQQPGIAVKYSEAGGYTSIKVRFAYADA